MTIIISLDITNRSHWQSGAAICLCRIHGGTLQWKSRLSWEFTALGKKDQSKWDDSSWRLTMIFTNLLRYLPALSQVTENSNAFCCFRIPLRSGCNKCKCASRGWFLGHWQMRKSVVLASSISRCCLHDYHCEQQMCIAVLLFPGILGSTK